MIYPLTSGLHTGPVPTPTPPGDKFEDIQTGEVTLSDGNSSVTDTITAVNLSKAVLEFSYMTDETGEAPEETFISGKIDSSTQLEFERMQTSGDVTIRWYIWEAKSSQPMTVQRGEASMNGAGGKVDVTIGAIVQDNAFAIITGRHDGTGPSDDDMTRARLTSSTNLEIEQGKVRMNDSFIPWQVINNPDWDVEELDFTSTSTTENKTIASSPTADTYLVYSGKNGAGSFDGDNVFVMTQTSNTNLNLVRDDATETWDLAIFIVNTNGDFSVQEESMNIAGSASSDTNTITAVDLDRAFIRTSGSCINSVVGRVGAFDLDGEEHFVVADLTNTTTVRIRRGGAVSNDLDFALQVIEVN